MSFSGDPSAGPLALLADLLWEPAQTLGGSGTGALDEPGADRYLAIPSRERPRYLLPLHIERSAQRALLIAYNDLRSPARRWARRIVADAAGLGWLPTGSHRVVEVRGQRDSEDTLLGLVAGHLGRAPDELVMAIGVNDKGGLVRPTLTVGDRSGSPLLFVKVARHPELQRRLEQEYLALADMQQHPVEGILTPAPVLLDDWAGRRVLGVSPLPLGVRGMHFREQPTARGFLERLHASRPAMALALEESAWAEATCERIAMLPPTWQQPLQRLLEGFLECHGRVEVEVGVRHGDWSPWNMAHSGPGRIAVWDWEFSQSEAPMILDRLNWDFAYSTSVRKTPTRVAARTLVEANPGDGTGVRMFLLDMAVRRAEEGSCGLHSSVAASQDLQALVGETSFTSRP